MGSAPVGRDGLVPMRVPGLEGLLPVFCWVELDLFSLKGSAEPSVVFWGICGLGMALGSLCVNGQCCLPILRMIWCVSSSPGSLLAFEWAQALVL